MTICYALWYETLRIILRSAASL